MKTVTVKAIEGDWGNKPIARYENVYHVQTIKVDDKSLILIEWEENNPMFVRKQVTYDADKIEITIW